MVSLRNRLALSFLAITAIAVAIVYFYVVPQLESRLRDEKLAALADDAQRFDDSLISALRERADRRELTRLVQRIADRANARVTVLAVPRGDLARNTTVIADSGAQSGAEDVEFQTAEEAAQSGRTVTGFEATQGGRLGQAARSLSGGERAVAVIVLSEPLTDVQASVALIRRQILIAGGIALVVALLAGFLAARALSMRIRRLEHAAKKVSAGDFSQPIPVDSTDELGRLALAFNDMQRQLAQLDSARKRFIATASHELRTPIFSLGGFIELLQHEELDEEERRAFLEQVRLQVERLRKLATELLDLSRLESGSLELRPEQTDVVELARGVAAEFRPALQNHRSTLDLELDGGRIDTRVDPDRLAQILRILLDNALTHTPAGTDIAVSAERANGSVRIAVEDHGLGIKRAVIGEMFEPFVTSDAQRSGLGLAIARDLAQRMSGELSVDSVPGRTTFTLRLPV